MKVEAEKSSPYTLIQEVTVSSSKAQYKQESKPTQGTLPSLRQEWVEFVFRGKAMAEKENMFTVTLPPIQTSVTVTTRLNSTSQTNYQTTMLVNKEKANPSPSMTIEGSSDPTQYEIRPVSYTHLDVYKRQVACCRSCKKYPEVKIKFREQFCPQNM